MRPLSALAAAVLVIGAAAGCSSSNSGDHTPSTPPATSTAAATPTTTATPTAAPTATATLSDGGRVALWYAGVKAHYASIQSDTEAIKSAAQHNKPSALPNLCAKMRLDVGTADGDPTPPNKLMAAAVSASLSAYGAAAQSCLAGDYNGAATGINTGAAYLLQADNIMNNLS